MKFFSQSGSYAHRSGDEVDLDRNGKNFEPALFFLSIIGSIPVLPPEKLLVTRFVSYGSVVERKNAVRLPGPFSDRIMGSVSCVTAPLNGEFRL